MEAHGLMEPFGPGEWIFMEPENRLEPLHIMERPNPMELEP